MRRVIKGKGLKSVAQLVVSHMVLMGRAHSGGIDWYSARISRRVGCVTCVAKSAHYSSFAFRGSKGRQARATSNLPACNCSVSNFCSGSSPLILTICSWINCSRDWVLDMQSSDCARQYVHVGSTSENNSKTCFDVISNSTVRTPHCNCGAGVQMVGAKSNHAIMVSGVPASSTRVAKRTLGNII